MSLRSILSLSFFLLLVCTLLPHTSYAACQPVSKVSLSPTTVAAGGSFTCSVYTSVVSGVFSCGLSVNGGFPNNTCPTFNGWTISGSSHVATFSCTLPPASSSIYKPGATYTLLGHDFVDSNCSGAAQQITITGLSTPTATNTPPPNQTTADITLHVEGIDASNIPIFLPILFSMDLGHLLYLSIKEIP